MSVEKPHARITLTEKVAYSSPLPIKSAKLDDLKKLEKYIPAEHKPFYANLTIGPCEIESELEDE